MLTANVPDTASDSDQPVEDFGRLLPPETVRRLSTLRPWVAAAHVAWEWVTIAAAIWASSRLFQWNVYAGAAGYVAAFVWVGSRQHALAILMHEGAHYRLFRRKWLNDLFAELFTAWPLMISVRAYRQHHFPHHRAPNTADDPDWTLRDHEDWVFPKTRGGLAKVFLFDLFGLNIRDQLQFFGRYVYPRGQRKTWLDYLAWTYFAGLAAVLTYFSLWPMFLVYWGVPLLTWLKVVLRMRTIAEHYGLEYDHPFRQTRTTYPALWERLLIAPKNIALHLDHHLYPSVPFYNLPELHRALLANDRFRREAHLTQRYTGVIRECLRSYSAPA